MPGLYQNQFTIERFIPGNIADATYNGSVLGLYVAPCDLNVLGLLAYIFNPNTGALNINVINSPTAQLPANVPAGAPNQAVAAYNLWTPANVPVIPTGTHTNVTAAPAVPLILNKPYALNYPLPGPAGTSGYATAQSTSQTTESPVVTPPVVYKTSITPLVAPDNTYLDVNSILTGAGVVHAGDILTFIIQGPISGGSDLNLELFVEKR